MAETVKVLAQNFPAAATLTDMYTCASALGAVLSSITVCNQSGVATTFRVSIAVAGAADATKQYLYFDVTLAGNDTFIATVGLTVANTDVVRVRATLNTISFMLFGTELS